MLGVATPSRTKAKTGDERAFMFCQISYLFSLPGERAVCRRFHYQLLIYVPGTVLTSVIYIHTVQGRGGSPWKPQSENGRQGGGHGLETAGLSSVHLLEEFVSGVFVAVILHLVELPLFGGQHGVDLLGERDGDRIV